MRGRTHSTKTIQRALELCRGGLSDYKVGQSLGIPRSTVQNWRKVGPPKGERRSPDKARRPDDERLYAYLLGMYLGDGWLSHHGRTSALSFRLDAGYPSLIEECARAMDACNPGRVRRLAPERGSVRLYSYGANWPTLFPQHGPGKKHERKIALVGWQRVITFAYPREFIRGLIHSDGSRCINRFAVSLPSGRVARYEYPRYFFTNYSADIRRIFCEHCDLLGIRWSQSNPTNISVANRESVRILDSFVGPKF